MSTENTVSIHDKHFDLYKSEAEIAEVVRGLGRRISSDYRDKTPLFIPVLNGAFMFASDLVKEVDIPCELSFIKVASYQGTSSSGEVEEILGFDADVAGRHVIIVEDIVDTGLTMEQLLSAVKVFRPASVAVATLLHKAEATKVDLPLHYVGLEVPNKFLVGYGLDYDQLGRNLRALYQLSGTDTEE